MAEPTVQAPVEVIEGFGVYVETCECTYVHTHHRTKAGAYRAMRQLKLKRWAEHLDSWLWQERVLKFEEDRWPKREKRWHCPFAYYKVTVQPARIEIYE